MSAREDFNEPPSTAVVATASAGTHRCRGPISGVGDPAPGRTVSPRGPGSGGAHLHYKPSELGYTGEIDHRGRFRATEALLFVGYGVTRDISVEFEVAGIRATLDRAPEDVSGVPARLVESGVGDIEGQVRWRWHRETARRPEFFSYAEAVVPHASEKPLIGTPGWEVKFGTGLIRGFSWGTITARASMEYAAGSTSRFDVGEYALEYLKRLSPGWRVYVGVEGVQDEVVLITEGQWHVSKRAFVRVNSAWGLTSKAADWAPEIGIVFALPTGRTPRWSAGRSRSRLWRSCAAGRSTIPS